MCVTRSQWVIHKSLIIDTLELTHEDEVCSVLLLFCMQNDVIIVCPAKVSSTVDSQFTINSLAPGKFELNVRYLILQIISVTDGWGISYELALRWMSLVLTDDKSTLVQVMAWCRQATSQYLCQCWPTSLSPYGVTRPQWVNPFLQNFSTYTLQIVDIDKCTHSVKLTNTEQSFSKTVCPHWQW